MQQDTRHFTIKRENIISFIYMSVDIRNEYEKELFDELFDKLEAITFPVIRENNRRGFPKHRALTLGLVKNRMFRYCGISKQSEKFPELTDYILTFLTNCFILILRQSK